MAWAVAACLAADGGVTIIRGAECVAVSYPRFFEDLGGLTTG
jgi:5-enolpyruvylshikimate-3-phosphate synthase